MGAVEQTPMILDERTLAEAAQALALKDKDLAKTLAKAWQPHRATAARMLWHYYLNGP